MIKGIYSSEAAMRPKMARMEVLANNLANINTTGFKRDRVFVRMLEQSSQAAADGRGDMTGVTTGRYIDTTSGSLQQTDNPLDLAIDGDGFFAVQTPRGTRLTRNGNFTLSKEGVLTTAEGYPVMGMNGAIQLPQRDRLDVRSLAITQSGEVVMDKEPLGQLRIMVPERADALQKDHESLMFVDQSERLLDVAPDKVSVRQGFVEESNVEGIEEMIAMIELSRGFETDQKMIQSQDATLDRSLEIGRV
jgi:flagellar basal-body rod protein FlgG